MDVTFERSISFRYFSTTLPPIPSRTLHEVIIFLAVARMDIWAMCSIADSMNLLVYFTIGSAHGTWTIVVFPHWRHWNLGTLECCKHGVKIQPVI